MQTAIVLQESYEIILPNPLNNIKTLKLGKDFISYSVAHLKTLHERSKFIPTTIQFSDDDNIVVRKYVYSQIKKRYHKNK